MAKRFTILASAASLVLVAETAWAADASTTMDAGTAVHAGALMLLTWCLASLRIRRRNGQMRIGFELSPVRRVRALSTVHGVKRGSRD